MAKITVGTKTQQSGYFDVAYKFILDVPQAQVGKESEALTKEVSGVAGYANGTDIEVIKADLINRYNQAQDDLNKETKLSFYGLSWDGSKWN